jgi:hypothetical protein
LASLPASLSSSGAAQIGCRLEFLRYDAGR